MEVRITRVWPGAGKGSRVRFATEFGSAEGEWYSGVPIPGERYLVEIEIPEPAEWGVTLVSLIGGKPSISTENGQTIVEGTLETAEPDGWTVLRMGASLLVVEAIGTPPSTGGIVRLITSKLVLFPSDKVG